VAEALNLSVRSYSRIESGKRPPDPDERHIIAETCGVPTLFLEFGWTIIEAGSDRAPLSDDEINRAAALLAPQLLAAARALRRAPPSGRPDAPEPGHPQGSAAHGSG
jgi:transcriptional regulator with XRE-family HTH domain